MKVFDKHKLKVSSLLPRSLKTLGFLLAGMILVSCEDFFISEAENVDIPGSEPRLVVNSYISPQNNNVKVHVHRSQPYTLDPSHYEDVGDKASVWIGREGEEMIMIPYNEQNRCFMIDAAVLEIEQGNTYQLKVESEEGEVVTAQCIIPDFTIDNINIVSADIENVYEDPEGIWNEKIFKLNWNLTAEGNNEENFYRSGAFMQRHLFVSDSDTVFILREPFWLERGLNYFSDSEGKTYNFRAEGWHYPITDYYPPNHNYDVENERYEVTHTIDSVFVFVYQLEENYYRYHQSVDDYFYFGDDFPFSETVFIHTNIEGGLGTFGGYNRMHVYVPFEGSAMK